MTTITAEIHDVIHPRGTRVYIATLGDKLGRPTIVGQTFSTLAAARAWVEQQEARLGVTLALDVNVRP